MAALNPAEGLFARLSGCAHVLAAISCCNVVGVATAHPLEYASATAGLVSSPTSTADCFYLTLVGVTPDPGLSWFAVPRSHPGFREIVALVTSAKFAGAPIAVRTQASMVCGYRGVEYVYLQ